MEVKLRRLGLAALTLFALSLLTACGGGPPPATSWPGAMIDGDSAYVAFNQHVYAVDLKAQTKRWQWPAQPTADTYYGAPALINERLIVGGYAEGRVYAINPADGSTVWTFSPDWGEVVPGVSFLKYPNGNFVAGAGANDGTAYIGTNNGYLFALDTGATDDAKRLAWPPFRTLDHNGFWSRPLVTSDTLYVTSLGHQLYALDPASGSQRQTVFKTDAPVAGDVAIAGKLAIMGTFGNRVLAVDTATQKEQWSVEVNDWVWGVPQIYSDTVYAATLSGTVYALRVADGSEIWRHQLSNENPAVRAPLLVTDKAIFAAGRDGKLYALDRASGQALYDPVVVGQNVQLLSQPLLWAPDKVVVTPMGATDNSLLYVYNAADGSYVSKFTP